MSLYVFDLALVDQLLVATIFQKYRNIYTFSNVLLKSPTSAQGFIFFLTWSLLQADLRTNQQRYPLLWRQTALPVTVFGLQGSISPLNSMNTDTRASFLKLVYLPKRRNPITAIYSGTMPRIIGPSTGLWGN